MGEPRNRNKDGEILSTKETEKEGRSKKNKRRKTRKGREENRVLHV